MAIYSTVVVLYQNPKQQGLKLARYCIKVFVPSSVLYQNPKQQGLKQWLKEKFQHRFGVLYQNPKQQGLKLICRARFPICFPVLYQNPKQQGLKLLFFETAKTSIWVLY